MGSKSKEKAAKSLSVARRILGLPVQQSHERCCGQLCVAAILGLSREEVRLAFGGHWSGTNGQHVIKALIKLGCKVEPLRRIKKNERLPVCAMVRIKEQRSDKRYYSHWVVVWETLLYDPCGLCNFQTLLSGKWQITSYLPILAVPGKAYLDT